ncbi:MAG: YicC/YloC family endoribonuclease [Polyangiaceae bacterium]
MTGFGSGEAPLTGGRVVAEVRSVNQRFLDVRSRLPRELGDLALFAEQVVRERLRRGRVELAVRAEGGALPASTIDAARAREAFRALGAVRDDLAPGSDLPLSLLAAVPDLFVAPSGLALETLREAVRAALLAALDALAAMCEREGAALAADLAARATAVRAACARIDVRLPAVREAARGRLLARLATVVASIETRLDPARLELEVALLCERSDVSEELTRLVSHLDQLQPLLVGPSADPVGRRIDFLLQEMTREISTLGAKAQDAALAHEVIAIKVELERMREQVQNVE